MKICNFFIIGTVTSILSACGSSDRSYDASGVFEVTQVTVSAQNTGEIVQLNTQEGQLVEANKPLGYIDTLQLHLKKRQLLATMTAVESRHYNVSRQIASIRQQIATQEKEKSRYESLLKSNAANQKQLDDINAQIALLTKQLAAQTETIENNNRSISGESLGLEAQMAQLDDQIRKSTIDSPINGTVLSTYVEPGEWAMQGKALFKVADITRMNLRVYVTADQLSTLQIGQSVHVYTDEGKTEQREYSGIVTWIADQAEFTPKNIQTRDERANQVYAVKVAVKNDGYIKKGMYGEIKIK